MPHKKDSAYVSNNVVSLSTPPPVNRTAAHHTTRHWHITCLLVLLLCANVISSWAFPPTIALASTHPRALPAHLTLQQ